MGMAQEIGPFQSKLIEVYANSWICAQEGDLHSSTSRFCGKRQ